MKIKLHLKDPDGVGHSVMNALNEEDNSLEFRGVKTLSICESRERDAKYERIRKAIEPWVQYGEYVTIEIDSDTGTARVLEV